MSDEIEVEEKPKTFGSVLMPIKETKIEKPQKCVFVSDGVYKYVDEE